LYWPALTAGEKNSPPEIQTSDPAEGAELLFDLPQVVAFVVVIDPNEEDTLEYVWTIERFGPQPSVPLTTESVNGSMITLQKDPSFNGRKLTCTVYDSFGASDSRQWIIVIPEVEV